MNAAYLSLAGPWLLFILVIAVVLTVLMAIPARWAYRSDRLKAPSDDRPSEPPDPRN